MAVIALYYIILCLLHKPRCCGFSSFFDSLCVYERGRKWADFFSFLSSYLCVKMRTSQIDAFLVELFSDKNCKLHWAQLSPFIAIYLLLPLACVRRLVVRRLAEPIVVVSQTNVRHLLDQILVLVMVLEHWPVVTRRRQITLVTLKLWQWAYSSWAVLCPAGACRCGSVFVLGFWRRQGPRDRRWIAGSDPYTANIESIFAVTEQLDTCEAASVTRLGNFWKFLEINFLIK